MRALVQRVSEAAVLVDGRVVGNIGPGLLVFLGVHQADTSAEIPYLVDKVTNLRVFPDDDGKMNCSLKDAAGEALVVSQFTLYGDCRKGRRPSYSEAAPPPEAERLYEGFCAAMRKVVSVQTGVFQAHMEVRLVNDGPVTLMVDTPAKGGYQ